MQAAGRCVRPDAAAPVLCQVQVDHVRKGVGAKDGSASYNLTGETGSYRHARWLGYVVSARLAYRLL